MSGSSDLNAVRQVLTADIPALDAAGHTAARQRALKSADGSTANADKIRSARRGRRRRQTAIRIALAGAVVALALSAVIALGGAGDSTPLPTQLEVPSAEAAVILNRVAVHLAGAGRLHGAQARVIRESMLQLVVAPTKHGGSARYVLPRTIEQGFDARGNSFYEEFPDGRPRFANAAAEAAYIRAFGRYVPIPPKPRIEWRNGPYAADPNVLNLSAHQVLSLPSDPTALKARLLHQRGSLVSQDEPHDLVYLASRLLTFGPTPPAVQAALARLLAKLPGVHRLRTVKVGGRPADLLSFPGAMQLAFDRRTGQLLEEIDVLPQRSRGYPGVAPGSVVDVIAYSTAVAPTIDTPVHVPSVTPVDGPRP